MPWKSSSARSRQSQGRRGRGQDTASPSVEGAAQPGRARAQGGARPSGAEGSRRGATRKGKPVEEGGSLVPQHDQIEKGVTRMGKVAQDRKVSVAGIGEKERETPGGGKDKADSLPSKGGTEPSSPVRKSRAVERATGSDDEEEGDFRYAPPGRNLVVVRLSSGSSIAPPSVRSSFQTAQGSPGSAALATEVSAPSTPRDLYDEEEENVGEKATLRQLCSPAAGKISGGGGRKSAGTSSGKPSPVVTSGGSPGSRREEEDKGKEVVGEEGERKEARGRGVDPGGKERAEEGSDEEEESESEASEESASGDSTLRSSSAATSLRAPVRPVVRLDKAIYCKKEFER